MTTCSLWMRSPETCDDRVFLIDTGMLSETYQGRASAIELTDTGATAIYPDDRVPLTNKIP